jgi:hybrid cluster-associated redox disulfide protein
MINVLIGLAVLGALGIAALSLFRQRYLRMALHEAQRRLYLVQARLNEVERTVERELRGLHAVVRRQSGSPRIEPTMKIADAIAVDPRIHDILAQFHLGGCNSCAINEEHTIEQAAMSYGVNLDHVMAALAGLVREQETSLSETRHGNLLQLTEF